MNCKRRFLGCGNILVTGVYIHPAKPALFSGVYVHPTYTHLKGSIPKVFLLSPSGRLILIFAEVINIIVFVAATPLYRNGSCLCRLQNTRILAAVAVGNTRILAAVAVGIASVAAGIACGGVSNTLLQ